MKISPTDSGCGAEIEGVDLHSMSDDEVEAIADAQAAYGVVFFRGQTLTADDQLAAARRFHGTNGDSPAAGRPVVPSAAAACRSGAS